MLALGSIIPVIIIFFLTVQFCHLRNEPSPQTLGSCKFDNQVGFTNIVRNV